MAMLRFCTDSKLTRKKKDLHDNRLLIFVDMIYRIYLSRLLYSSSRRDYSKIYSIENSVFVVSKLRKSFVFKPWEILFAAIFQPMPLLFTKRVCHRVFKLRNNGLTEFLMVYIIYASKNLTLAWPEFRSR